MGEKSELEAKKAENVIGKSIKRGDYKEYIMGLFFKIIYH